MKQKISSIVIIIFVINIIIVSCATPMKLDKSATLRESMRGTNTGMEFIGFKGAYDTLGSDYDTWQKFKKDTAIAKFGDVLQDRGIAYNQSFAYFGIYSLQEIAAYKSKQRFVTFIETEKNHFSYVNKGGVLKPILIGAGAGLLGLGLASVAIEHPTAIGFSLAGAGSLIAGLLIPSAQTTITFNGIYSIYVYDTVNKEIIYKDTVNVALQDKYKGKYEDANTDKNAVLNYYATLAFNEIIKKYDEVYRFLETKK